jgi:hypothetical protein
MLLIGAQSYLKPWLQVEQYIVVGSMGGRLDHVFANIETLHTAASLTSIPVFLISEGNLACLLPRASFFFFFFFFVFLFFSYAGCVI